MERKEGTSVEEGGMGEGEDAGRKVSGGGREDGGRALGRQNRSEYSAQKSADVGDRQQEEKGK